MSCLNLIHRPTVIFDPNNKEHRQAVSIFYKTGTWGQIKVNFLLESPYYDLPGMIAAKLTKYYLNTEFKRGKK
jgi:hypothetical protein